MNDDAYRYGVDIWDALVLSDSEPRAAVVSFQRILARMNKFSPNQLAANNWRLETVRVDAVIGLAGVYSILGAYEDAYQQLVSLEPRPPGAPGSNACDRAYLLEQMGRSEEAGAQLAAALADETLSDSKTLLELVAEGDGSGNDEDHYYWALANCYLKPIRDDVVAETVAVLADTEEYYSFPSKAALFATSQHVSYATEMEISLNIVLREGRRQFFGRKIDRTQWYHATQLWTPEQLARYAEYFDPKLLPPHYL